MDINEILYQINQISDSSERYFMDLGTLFPSLLTTKENGTSIQAMQGALTQLKDANNKSSESDSTVFSGYDEKYTPLFEQLNTKIETLSELDKMIAGIKEDSEQMELIALNAMVISIKSGEKGQAFSRITENLQRLSKDMFLFSDQLLEEEKHLIGHINELRTIFTNILNAQKDLSSKGITGAGEINMLISNIQTPLQNLEDSINTVYPPIQKAMEDLQLQDIIRQALDHVKSCLNEINDMNLLVPGSDEELDAVTFNIALFELAVKVLEDISNHVTNSFLEFDQNWSTVTDSLEKTEKQKDSFNDRFINEDTGSHENIRENLDKTIGSFRQIMDEFSHYHLVQKDLVHTTQSINEKARTMYSVFGNLRPVMSRLHHVRILQQIEVSKNDAIKSVTDSVTDMDNLINSANKSLDTMEKLLSVFIQETTGLLSKFNSNIEGDNQKMVVLRKNKSAFFDQLKIAQTELIEIISHFEVFPMGFQKKCEKVAKDLSGIQEIGLRLKQFKSDIESEITKLNEQKKTLMTSKNLVDWKIKNQRFSEIINKFTITAHKEAAGQIAGLEVEHGAASGEITFF